MNRKLIVCGNPSVEPGYVNDPTKFSRLRSALAVPLDTPGGIVGVHSLYHQDRDAFTEQDRDLALVTKLAALLASPHESIAIGGADDQSTIDNEPSTAAPFERSSRRRRSRRVTVS